MENCWLIPMDYIKCDYSRLKKEWEDKGKIMWEVPGKPKKTKNNQWMINTKMAKSLHTGAIVYFYVTNLPSESQDKLSRIMLRGIIEDEPRPMLKKQVYIDYKGSDAEEMIIGFSIGKITTLSKEQLENNMYLCYDDLLKIDSNFKHPQGKYWPNNENGLSDKIISTLEGCFKQDLNKNDFGSLISHFNRKCFFCDKIGNKTEHRTFTGRNGLDYFEYHHFIPQCKSKKNDDFNEIVNDQANGLYLCSNCHNKIHYGRIEDVKEMINVALKDKGIINLIENNKHKFEKEIGQISLIDWLYDAYNINTDK